MAGLITLKSIVDKHQPRTVECFYGVSEAGKGSDVGLRGSLIRSVFVALAALCALAAVPSAARATDAAGVLNVPTLTAPPPMDPKGAADAWKDAADAPLPWDVQHQRPSTEAATARVSTDGKNLYVRFDVTQRETLLTQQHANNVGDGTDDEVWVDLWPNGPNGFYYQFAATANGTHFQYSSENTAYAPTWDSFGAPHEGGFTVTMRIPLKIVRGTGSSAGWRIQFVRIIRSTGERQIWTYGPAQTNGDDLIYAGSLTGLAPAVASKAQPRLAVYALGAAGNEQGLATSRMGADISIPFTPTASFYSTIHPDFSNVEIDQQTIAPTAFARSYTEVRPFFTQGTNYFDNFDCDVCPFIAQLYTPAIPTPRDGYAFEGKQGPIAFAGFDAVGDGRNDGATSLRYNTPDNKWHITAQDVFANIPGGTDHTDTAGIQYSDSKHIDTYFDYGSDSGTNVLAGDRAQRYDGGAYWYTNTFGIGGSMRKLGEYYQPVDGFIQHPDIAGYAVFENKLWLFNKPDVLNSIQFGSFFDRYQGHTGGFNQTDNNVFLDVLTRNLIDVQFGVGSSYLRLSKGTFTPVSQNGVTLTWHSGSFNNPGQNENHGSSATPTTVTWYGGRFGPGMLDTWLRSSTLRVGNKATFTGEFDDTTQWLDAGGRNVQWLERYSYNYATGPDSSFSLGVRRIIGTAPLFDPSSPPSYTNAYNLSFAVHKRLPHDELYIAYGDASQLITVPQFIIKLIHYFGAEKGT